MTLLVIGLALQLAGALGATRSLSEDKENLLEIAMRGIVDAMHASSQSMRGIKFSLHTVWADSAKLVAIKMGEQNKHGPSDKTALDWANSDAELVAHLERLTGRRIKSRQDISDYVRSLSEQATQKRLKSQYLKKGLLAGLLAIAALQYYFIDVQLQILSQQTLTVFVPAKGEAPWQPSGRS